MGTFWTLQAAWNLLLFLNSGADAFKCFSCYHSESPLNWKQNESEVTLPFDSTCRFESKPNPKLMVDCDDWIKNEHGIENASNSKSNLKNAFSRLKSPFEIGKEQADLISWTCATFSFDGWLNKTSSQEEFKGTFRSCFPYGNGLKDECNRGRLDNLGDRYGTEIMQKFIHNLTSVHHLTLATETVACICPEDNCNGENFEVAIGSATSNFQNLGAAYLHSHYFCLFAFVFRMIELR